MFYIYSIKGTVRNLRRVFGNARCDLKDAFNDSVPEAKKVENIKTLLDAQSS